MGWGWYFGASIWMLMTIVDSWAASSMISKIRNTVDDIHDMVTDIHMGKTQGSDKSL